MPTARAQRYEEPGDLLGESLTRLAMKLHVEFNENIDFEVLTQKIAKIANKTFWENEINNRIAFLSGTREKLRRQRASRYKRQALQALDGSLDRLTGGKGRNGLQAEEFAQWVQAWVRDLQHWHKTRQPVSKCETLPEAMEFLGVSGGYLHEEGNRGKTDDSAPNETAQNEKSNVRLEPVEPIGPHPEKIRRKLEHTFALEQFLAAKNMDIERIVLSANRLRYDRPTVTLWEQSPFATVSMIVSFQEPVEHIRQSFLDIKHWLPADTPIQFVLWVYSGTGSKWEDVETYLNRVTAALIVEAMGTTILIRSSINYADDPNIDYRIELSLNELAFAYWKSSILASHMVYVVNSANEVLRYGTFWDFIRGEHRVPDKALVFYLRSLRATADYTWRPVPKNEDENALTSACMHLIETDAAAQLPANLRGKVLSIPITKYLHRANLSLVQADDLVSTIRFHHKDRHVAVISVPNIICVPIEYRDNLPSDKNELVREIIASAENNTTRPVDCMVVVYGGHDITWEEIAGYRSALMEIVKKRCVSSDIVFSSMMYRLTAQESYDLFKKRVLCRLLYALVGEPYGKTFIVLAGTWGVIKPVLFRS